MKILPALLWYTAFLLAVKPHLLTANDAVEDFWFSGAEISRYELNQSRYGAQHPGHAELIFVTEPFLTQQQVKNETGGQPSTDVLKLNALRTFNTGIYSYRTMTSTFRPVDVESFPHALKTTTSVQDWCGHSFQQINRKEPGWRVELRSYFEREGDQNYDLEESWLEDELWLLIRLDPRKLPTGSIQVVPGAVTTRFEHHPIRSYTATARLEQGSGQIMYMLNYPELKKSLEITFDKEFPYIIRSWKEISPKGTTTATLTHRIMNSNYWSENKPGDRGMRKQLGLEPIAD